MGFSGFRTAGAEGHFNSGPVYLFNERPKATYFSLLHNTTLKDIILQIINSVK